MMKKEMWVYTKSQGMGTSWKKKPLVTFEALVLIRSELDGVTGGGGGGEGGWEGAGVGWADDL